MCLTTKIFAKKHTATTDITVYKFLYKSTVTDNLFTPYLSKIVSIGETYISLLSRCYFNEVHMGLHSFADYDDCLRHAKTERSDIFETVVVECTIPSGSRYYQGKFHRFNSIASDRLVYNKILITLPKL